MGNMDGSGASQMMDASSKDPLYLAIFAVLFFTVLAVLWIAYKMAKDE